MATTPTKKVKTKYNVENVIYERPVKITSLITNDFVPSCSSYSNETRVTHKPGFERVMENLESHGQAKFQTPGLKTLEN